jgi:hypothetical protein
MTTQDYIFSGEDANTDEQADNDEPRDCEPDLNAESGRERQLREYREKYR